MSSGAQEPPGPRASIAAYLAVGHALMTIVLLSWWFGGMHSDGREVATFVAALSPIITAMAWRGANRSLRRRFLRFAMPLGLLGLVVVVSFFNQNTRMLTSEGIQLGLVPRSDYFTFLPSNAWPPTAVPDFLLNAGIILTAINVFLTAPPRSAQRFLLVGISLNAGVLACVGSAFKLTGAEMVFGRFPSPNQHFFSSFYYYNHWGAFAILGAAAAAGLALDFLRRNRAEPWVHTPGPFFAVLAVVLLVSIPLAGGRASTGAALVLTLVLALRFSRGNRKPRSLSSRRIVVTAAIAVVVCTTGAWLAKDSLRAAFEKSEKQLSAMRQGETADARLTVYKETWQLFREKPIYGWGWHSFRYAFRRIQSLDFKQQNEQKVKSVFLNAHNDWLQLLAELGIAGAALSFMTLLGVARAASFRWWKLAPSTELVAGVACVALLACVDFPFACPAVVITAWTFLSVAAGIAHDREAQAAPA
jgi:O-antigen ligase